MSPEDMLLMLENNIIDKVIENNIIVDTPFEDLFLY